MISKIKKRLFGFGLYSVACLSLFAQKGGRAATPVYLDENNDSAVSAARQQRFL